MSLLQTAFLVALVGLVAYGFLCSVRRWVDRGTPSEAPTRPAPEPDTLDLSGLLRAAGIPLETVDRPTVDRPVRKRETRKRGRG